MFEYLIGCLICLILVGMVTAFNGELTLGGIFLGLFAVITSWIGAMIILIFAIFFACIFGLEKINTSKIIWKRK